MNKLGQKRLEKLINHLKKGKLSVDKFNFGTYHTREDCGTSGCAAGELPALFPKHWYLNEYLYTYWPQLRKSPRKGDTAGDLEEFFDLSYGEVTSLFYSREGYPQSTLPPHATKGQVARNMEKFLKAKQKDVKLIKIKIKKTVDKRANIF